MVYRVSSGEFAKGRKERLFSDCGSITVVKPKSLLPIIISIPTVFVCLMAAYSQATGNHPLDFISTAWRTFVILLPLIAFSISVAMLFTKENSTEWRLAAVFNGIPLGLILLVLLFFALIGYRG